MLEFHNYFLWITLAADMERKRDNVLLLSYEQTLSFAAHQLSQCGALISASNQDSECERAIVKNLRTTHNVYINAHVATEMRRKVAAKIRRESRGQRHSGQERRSSENESQPAGGVSLFQSGGDRADS